MEYKIDQDQKRLPAVADQRKKAADEWRSARRANPAIARLLWRQMTVAKHELIDKMRAEMDTAWNDGTEPPGLKDGLGALSRR